MIRRAQLFAILLLVSASPSFADPYVATFSIVASDPDSGEVGVAVASRFFAVGSVVPFGEGAVGAIATQANADVSFGPRGLELLARGVRPEEIVDILLRGEPLDNGRQFGIVAADGSSSTYTGPGCLPWAGGRAGANYAVQGNILTGEEVVIAMEAAFLATNGTLADRMYAALLAGDARGGDSRGKQSAALMVRKPGSGYGGKNDRAIDIRVDDHAEPFQELGRLLDYAQMNYAWNEAWTGYVEKNYARALPPMERAARLAPDVAEVHYDLAVIRLANEDQNGALAALETALALNPKLQDQASKDDDLDALRDDDRFKDLIRP
ncbi:MAG: DUF1028 domain-containing protein [Gammaproteobacteria bacterium]|nr:DUF1028 domain-containing protein [Gammaproteobacteria bacterium]MDH5302869.1 DUF1028 domain-containing protein [Gammaproteobacteria bacterium]MDH5323703.1 DUF1028 domain-containing protein [Gammaproteobacteria bacterium]